MQGLQLKLSGLVPEEKIQTSPSYGISEEQNARMSEILQEIARKRRSILGWNADGERVEMPTTLADVLEEIRCRWEDYDHVNGPAGAIVGVINNYDLKLIQQIVATWMGRGGDGGVRPNVRDDQITDALSDFLEFLDAIDNEGHYGPKWRLSGDGDETRGESFVRWIKQKKLDLR
jgi:hypothetical protein